MQTYPYALPIPIGNLLSHLPAYPGSLLFVAALNLVLTKNLPFDIQHQLIGKTFRIKVLDAQCVFDFSYQEDGFTPCNHLEEVDLTIAANAHDFLLLAQRREDPDTFFFNRRLLMEGDTELGLLLKNTFDAMESSAFDPREFTPARKFSQWLRKRKAKPIN
jgi:O2-independent ubiquinone biosynthesis accessory factor UbiT